LQRLLHFSWTKSPALRGSSLWRLATHPNTLLFGVTAGLLVLAWLAYVTGLDGPFLVDDFPNITTNDAIKIDELTLSNLAAAAESGRAGPVKRPLSMMSFAVDHAFAGLDAPSFKRTNLLIHTICGLLIARLAFLLVSRVFWRQAERPTHLCLALLVMGIWLIHPLQLTNVLYVVQRMNSLSGLFSLAAIVCYVSGRFRTDGVPAIPSVGRIAAVVAFTLAAVLSKENGLLVPLFLGAIELSARYSLAGTDTRHQTDRTLLIVLSTGGAIGAGLLVAFWDVINGSYVNRDFNLPERLLTEARALVWYLRLMAVPDITAMGLLHDDWTKSTSLIQPISTLLSILALLGLTAAAWLLRFRFPLLLFGVLWFLAGHAMESSVWPLLLVFEHRNYLPIFGVALPLAVFAARVLAPAPAIVSFAVAVLVLGGLYHQTRERAHVWSDDAVWIQTQVRNHPMSPSAHYFKGVLFAQFASYVPAVHREKVVGTAAQSFDEALRLNPRDISPVLAKEYHWSLLGLPVPDADLSAVPALLQEGNVSYPVQNAVLLHCRKIAEGSIPYRADLHDRIFESLLENPRLSNYIRERMSECAHAVRHEP
jgi:hypothetical protein